MPAHRACHALTRIVHAACVLAGASAVVFAAGQMMPGDTAEVLLRQTTDAPAPERVEGLRQMLRLDQGLPRRYLHWVGSVLSGDLGRSWRTGEPVAALVAERVGATATLALAAFAVVVLLGLVAGSLAVLSRGRWSETVTRVTAIVIASVPSFWLGTLLIEFFGVRMAWLPFVGRGGWTHHVLPALTLGLGVGAAQGRILRSVLSDLASQDFVRFAYAAGLTPRAILFRRLLPNALPPVLTLWGMSLGQLLGGAFIVESIFSWPGLGRLTVDAVLSRDLPVLQGSVLAVTFIFVLSTEVVRILQDWLDPRLARSAVAAGGERTDMRHGSALVGTGATLLGVVVLTGVLAPLAAPADPLLVDLERRLASPSLAYPLGTDHLGRCVLSRVLWGARASLGGAFFASLGAIGLGWLVGTLAAFSGRRVDLAARGVIDMGLAFPGVALALVTSGVLGPGLAGLSIGLAIALAAWWARFVHDTSRLALSKEYVLAARVAGVGRGRILRHYVLPQVTPLLLVAAAWRFGLVLAALAGLSYLGLGAQPPTPEWGAMLHEGRVHLGRSLWPTLAPGLAITLTVGACVLMAEGLKDLYRVRMAVEED